MRRKCFHGGVEKWIRSEIKVKKNWEAMGKRMFRAHGMSWLQSIDIHQTPVTIIMAIVIIIAIILYFHWTFTISLILMPLVSYKMHKFYVLRENLPINLPSTVKCTLTSEMLKSEKLSFFQSMTYGTWHANSFNYANPMR